MTLSLPSEDQRALARGVADFLADRFPLARLREATARDVERWGELADIGVFGLSAPMDQGGLGLGVAEEVLVARELGRALVSPAAIAGMLAPRLPADRTRPIGIALGVLDGEARVADGGAGAFLLVEGARLSLIESRHRALRSLDETVELTAVALPGEVLAAVEAPGLALLARLLAAAFLVGLLETARDGAADHARSRVQFGRPIGAFQAIKHRCADAALGAELAWCQVWAAADALAEARSDAKFQVMAAKWLAGDEALKAARFDIQAHGGMGFTQEADAHRLLKRAHVLHQMFGNPRLVPAQLVRLPVEV